MKASPKKIVVLAVIMAVFCIGALTNRWAAKCGYDHINHRSDQAEESGPDSISYSNQVDDPSTYSDAGQIESEAENRFVTAWISRSDNNHDSHDLAELQARPGDRSKLNRSSRNSVDSVSPQESENPDDSQDTYGDADVE